jgi:hypothetical protein
LALVAEAVDVKEEADARELADTVEKVVAHMTAVFEGVVGVGSLAAAVAEEAVLDALL